MKEFIIQKNEENQRFDKYLKKLLPNASTGFLHKMLRKKNITLNKKKAEGNEKLAAGDQVLLFFSDETFEKFHTDLTLLKKEYEMLAELPLKGLHIVYEDEDRIVAEKPYNMLSQKAKDTDLSANEYLMGYMIRSGALPFETFETFRPSVVNRLDRNTTGLLLFGKTLAGLQTLGKDMKDRSIKKYYLAVVFGELKENLKLKGWLKKDEAQNKVFYHKQEVPNASFIETDVTPLESKNGLTLVEIHLITGKTHQIRLHLSSIGYPIVGDRKYGNPSINKIYYESHKVNHQLLHAYRLEFPDGKIVTSDMPKVFQKLLS